MSYWEQIKTKLSLNQCKTSITKIEKIFSKNSIEYIISQINYLEKPNDIAKLRKIQQIQEENGGGFFGLVPPVIAQEDRIPIPSNPEQIVSFLEFCATKRMAAYELLISADYESKFYGNDFPKLNIKKPSSEIMNRLQINLNLDFFCLIINYFQKSEKDNSLLNEISNHPILEELITHRNGLGFVPGPKFTKEFYKKFLEMSHSQNPLENIWKMIHPWNFFDFADIYQNLDEYTKLYEILSANKETIESFIISELIDFIPQNREITEQIAFSVEWAIKGWASKKYAGVNIEFYKDNFEKLFNVIIHEVFHRIQLKILPKAKKVVKNEQELDFDILFDFDDLDRRNSLLYKAFSYIFLEGSATALGRKKEKPFTEEEIKKIETGLSLLGQIIKETTQLTSNDQQEEIVNKIESLLNQGLISNGPFYSLGEYISIQLISKYDRLVLGKILEEGIFKFYNLYLHLTEEFDNLIKFPDSIKETIILNSKAVNSFLKTQ